MSILDANGSVVCAECGRKARDERDQLKAENAKLREENQSIGMAAYELGCNSMADENEKLRELLARMAEALGIDSEWADPNWCKSPCVLIFGCWPNDEHAEILCPAWAAMRELRIEVD